MDITIIKTQKGKDCALTGGHRYYFCKYNKNGTSLWRCENRSSCSATITLNSTRTNIIRENTHSCASNNLRNSTFKLIDKCKKDVCATMDPVQTIYENNTQELLENNDEQEYRQWIPSFPSIKSSLYRERKKFLNVDKLIFHKLEDVTIPQTFGKNFFVCEDGTDKKILIFASTIARKFINSDKHGYYYGDGTFRCCPPPFYQIYGVHLDLDSNNDNSNIIPVNYGLLPNKSEETYIRFFNLLKNELNVQIRHFKCDYEQAQFNAIKRVYPEAVTTGCFFHYNRAIWRKIKQLKLNKSRAGRNIGRLTSLLPMLPPEFVQQSWKDIIGSVDLRDEKIKKFKAYFEKQWIKISHRELSVFKDKHRTTNQIEGWHRRLRARIPQSPNLFLYLHKLKKENYYQDNKLKKSLFESIKKTRRNIDIDFDRKYCTFLKKLQKKEISPMNFLKTIVFI